MELSAFLQYLQYQKRYSVHTCTAYKHDLEQFIEFVQTEHHVETYAEVKSIHIRGWVVSMMQAQKQPTSIQRKVSALRALFKYLKVQGGLDNNPFRGVVLPKKGQKLPVFLTETATQKLFEEIPFGEDFEGVRDRLLMEIFYATGLRRGELIGLCIDHLDLAQARMRIFGKGNKTRILPLPSAVVALIQKYLDIRQSTFPMLGYNELLLTDAGKPMYPKFVYNKVKHYLGLVTTQLKRSPHVMRHTFATQLSNEGAGISAIKELLGHTSLAATQIYTHNSIARLKEVYDKTHPKAKTKENPNPKPTDKE